nr:NADH-quinone oxidoreductase subunit NuoE [uncultured Holophaga sp.]
MNNPTTNTDNWEAIRATCSEALPAHIIDYIDQNREKAHAESQLIAILHMVQAHFGFLAEDKMHAVAQLAQVPLAKVTGVATFYHYFRLQPRGKHIINVCLGTACYVKGAEKLGQRLMDELGIHFGETTKDGLFSLESTRCLGTCGLAPVIMVGEEVYGPVSPNEIPIILEKYARKDRAAKS